MEVSADPIHTLAGEDQYPTRRRTATSSTQDVKYQFEAPDPDPDEACLLEHHSYSPPKSSSNGVTFINLLKSNIGAGFLAMPYAFYNIGLVVGCVAVPVVVITAIMGMRLLVGVKARLRDSEFRTKSDAELTYPAIANALLGRCGYMIVTIALFISQLGTCTAYLIFWGNTCADSFDVIPRWGCILIGAAVVLPICLVTNPRGLRWSSFLGLALACIALLALYGYNLATVTKHSTEDAPHNWKTVDTDVRMFPRFFGISTFAMEGITVVLPLEQSARNKHQFSNLMTISMLFCGLLFGSFGALGYATYGSNTEESILKNLPDGSPYVTVLKCIIALNLMATLPVQMFPISEILDQWLHAQGQWWAIASIRFSLMALVAGGAVAIHDFGDTLSIVGGFSFMIIGVIIPMLLHVSQCRNEMSLGFLVVMIIVIGQAVALMLLVTSMSLYNLAND